MYLFLDTETTGVTPNDRIVSLCWAIYDLRRDKLSSTYAIIRPEGFEIPADATAIHGITTADAKRDGISLTDALHELYSKISDFSPRLLIGHNIGFDRPIVLNEFARIQHAENITLLTTFCTMKGTASLCRIPSSYGGYKWPKLGELHMHLFGAPHSSAHNAQADVDACVRCFFELQTLGLVPSHPALERQL